MRTAKIRSHTRIGCTSARLPKLSATTCRANPAIFPEMAANHNGCRTRSSKIRGDSARRDSTRFVLRWSATEDIPSISADATAATTAISSDNCQPSCSRPGRPRAAGRSSRWAGCFLLARGSVRALPGAPGPARARSAGDSARGAQGSSHGTFVRFRQRAMTVARDRVGEPAGGAACWLVSAWQARFRLYPVSLGGGRVTERHLIGMIRRRPASIRCIRTRTPQVRHRPLLATARVSAGVRRTRAAGVSASAS
jgi:hypothetical protein